MQLHAASLQDKPCVPAIGHCAIQRVGALEVLLGRHYWLDSGAVDANWDASDGLWHSGSSGCHRAHLEERTALAACVREPGRKLRSAESWTNATDKRDWNHAGLLRQIETGGGSEQTGVCSLVQKLLGVQWVRFASRGSVSYVLYMVELLVGLHIDRQCRQLVAAFCQDNDDEEVGSPRLACIMRV